MILPETMPGFCSDCDRQADYLCDCRHCLRCMCRAHTVARMAEHFPPGFFDWMADGKPELAHLCQTHAEDLTAEIDQ